MTTRHLSDAQLCAHLGAPPPRPGARHLSGCEACRTRLAEFEQVLELAAAVPAPAWSPRRRQRLRHRARKVLFTRPRARRQGLAVAALAGALGTWALVVLLGPDQTAPPVPEDVSGPPSEATATVVSALAELDEEAWMTWIDDDLIDTASEAELLEQLAAVSHVDDPRLGEVRQPQGGHVLTEERM